MAPLFLALPAGNHQIPGWEHEQVRGAAVERGAEHSRGSALPGLNKLFALPAGGLQPAAAALLPQHRCVFDLLLCRKSCLLPQRPGGMGPRAEGLHASRALRPHRDPG